MMLSQYNNEKAFFTLAPYCFSFIAAGADICKERTGVTQ